MAVLLFLFVGFADGALVPFLALWAQREAGVATAFVGVLLACYAGGELLAAPLVGGVADRFGRRPVLLASTLGLSIGFFVLAGCRGPLATAIVLLLVGACESVLHPTIATVIADSVAADEARRQFALARVAVNAGRVLGPAAGALLALRSLGTVIVGAATALWLAFVIVLALLPETWRRDRPRDGREADEEPRAGGLLPALRDRCLVSLLAWFMLLELSGSWVEAVLPLHARDTGLLTPSGVGWLFTYGASVVLVFQLGLVRLLRHVAGSRLVLLGGAALATGLVTLLVSTSLPALVAAVTLFSVSQMLYGPLVPMMVNELAPASARATYMAAVSVGNDLKDTLGPATGTLLYAAAGRLPWLLGIPLVGLAAASLARVTRRRERDARGRATPCAACPDGPRTVTL